MIPDVFKLPPDDPRTVADGTRPYDEDSIPPYEDMQTIKLSWVRPWDLHPTQPMLDLARLLAVHDGHPCEGSDPHPHVIWYDDRMYVHNGHHRWMVALLSGSRFIRVRLYFHE